MIPKVAPKNYTMIQAAGSGAFATVYKAEYIPTHKVVAVKIFPKVDMFKKSSHERLKAEIRIHKHVVHPSITQFIETIEDMDNTYLITEYCSHGSLAELIHQKKQISEKEARKYFCQIASGVRYLHEVAHIIHRDLKVENIMIDRNDNARIIDFGLSIEFDPFNPYVKKSCGSPKYVAPEMFLGEMYNFKIDIWALGVNLYYCICGCYPFDDENLKQLAVKIRYDEPKYASDMSPNLVDLLKKMLQKHPTDRISWKELFEHPWVIDERDGALYRSRSQIRNKLDKKEVHNEENVSLNENRIGPISIKKRTRSNVNGLKHLLAPPNNTIVDRLCATGKFRRKEKKEGEITESSNLNSFANSILCSLQKRRLESHQNSFLGSSDSQFDNQNKNTPESPLDSNLVSLLE